MEKDFHYYCIAFLALNAGFKEQDALIIAYASQYVDDCRENGPTAVLNTKPEKEYDILRTSYFFLTAFSESTRKDVFIPFHFLPEHTSAQSQSVFSYVTKPDSDFSKTVVSDAIDDDDKDLRLFRLAIALHTYADTWAHHGFSGRNNDENDAADLYCFDEDDWQNLLYKFYEFCPELGHLEAMTIPDEPYRVWESKNVKKRYNLDNFLRAAENIYSTYLSTYNTVRIHDPEKWDVIKDTISLIFSKKGNCTERCSKWKKVIRPLVKNNNFVYDESRWEMEAFAYEPIIPFIRSVESLKYEKETGTGEEIILNHINNYWDRKYESSQDNDVYLIKKGESKEEIELLIQKRMSLGQEIKLKKNFETTNWYYFQEAAKKHHNFVSKKLPSQMDV